MKGLRSAIYLCLMISLANAPSVVGEAPGALVKELAHLAIQKKASSITGKITLTAEASDCRKISAAVDIMDKSEGTSVTGQDIFLSGAHVVVIGHVCLPAAGEELAINTNVRRTGDMLMEGGKVTFKGPVNMKGTASIQVVDSAKVVEVTSYQGIEFEIRKSGFAFVSGAGTVKISEGKIYDFKAQ